MNISDILILGGIALITAGIICRFIRRAKRGEGCCGCSSGCKGCGREISSGDKKETEQNEK